MKLRSVVVVLLWVLALINNHLFAQAPNISYSPSTNVLTINTAFSLSPDNSGGTVASLAYGTAASLSGATLANPWGMGIDPSGNIYVVNYNDGNYNNSSISKYNSAGVYQGTFGTSANISQPTGITFDASGNGYVLNYNRTNNGVGNDHGNAYVDQYNSAGVYQSTIIQGLGTANGIAMDASNNLYVAQGSYNGGANTASQFNTAGALAFSIAAGYTTNPLSVAVDGSYNIYVLDNTNQTVTKYSSTGVYLSTIVTGLNSPYAMVVDGAGNIYVGDSGSHTVTVYNPAGAIITSIAGLTDPRGLVTDSKGDLFVADYTNNTVTKRLPVGGYFISGALPPGLSFSSVTGLISGTPTVPFTAKTYTITAYNASGSSSTTVTLSCPPNLSIPSISYNPSINVFTIGTLVSLSPINTGGTPTGYTISATLPAGLTFNTSTGIISGTPTTKTAAKVFTVTASNGSGSSTTTVSIACVVDNYWTGSKNSDWNTKQNWSTNRVPVATDLASVGVINYTGSEPVILTGNTISAYYVTFGANARTLTVQTGATFTINNILTINNNATPNFIGQGTGVLNIAPAAVVNINGTGALTITNPSPTVNLVTLQSNATSSASIGQLTTGTIIGTVNVQRYVTGGAGYRAYRLMSSPVNAGTTDASGNTIYSINYLLNSTFITGTGAGFTAPSKIGNPSLYLYRENLVPSNSSFTSGNFRGISNISTSPYYSLDGDGAGFGIPVGNGYLMFFRGGLTTVTPYVTTSTPAPAILTASGTLNQGPVTVKHWFTPGTSGLMYTTVSGTPTVEGFNLVGNPYASTIDLATYTSGGIVMTNLSPFVYELDPVSKNYGQYELDGSNLSTNHASRYIASGQGFFVLALGSSPVPQLTFNETSKVENIQNTGLNLLMGKPLATTPVQYLRLQMAMDSVNTDETIIRFSDGAHNDYAFNEDAPYRTGSGKVNLSSLSSDNMLLAINKLPLSSNGASIALKVGATADGSYKINLTDIAGVPQLYNIWLKDAYTKDSVNMRSQASYSFNVSLADTNTFGTKRFTLILLQNPDLAYQLLNFTAIINAGNNHQVETTWKTVNEQNYTHFSLERSTNDGKTFDVVGSMVSTGRGSYSLVDKSPEKGNNLYRLKQEDYFNIISYSDVANVLFAGNGNKKSPVTVYPNPAVSIINLSIEPKSAAAAYNIKISNSLGMVIKQIVTTQLDWQGNVSDLLPGSYMVQVINKKDNSLVGETKFIKL